MDIEHLRAVGKLDQDGLPMSMSPNDQQGRTAFKRLADGGIAAQFRFRNVRAIVHYEEVRGLLKQ